jgi:hypothetical protein
MADIYLDPTVAGTGTGTFADPFKDWTSVTWTAGNRYLQKRGTTYRKKITIGANNVTLGAYGTGDKPIIRADLSFTPTWTAQSNGEYSCPAPANSYGSSSSVAMFLKNGLPVTKRGSVGSLGVGECQSSGTTIYYKPVNGDHLTASFSMVYQDFSIVVPSGVVRDSITVTDLWLQYVHVGFYTGTDAGTEAATNWTLGRVEVDWAARGAIHFVKGSGVRIFGSRFSKFASTELNFGLAGTSSCNNVAMYDTIVEEGGAWISDTNLEGHALDMVEGCSGLYIRGCVFRNHGASYPSSTYNHAGQNPSYRPDATLSFDGVSNVYVNGNLFENNCLAPIQCGNYVDGAPIVGSTQHIVGNVFDGNLRKFTVSDSANATMFTCVQVLGDNFVDVRVENNTFVNNGNGLRLGGEHQRPCLVYCVTTVNGATLDLKVKENIFGKNNVASLLVMRIVAASGTIPGANIARNIYMTQDASLWSDSTKTNYIYVEPATVSYRVPFSHTFAAYQSATSADTGSSYQFNPELRTDYMPMASAVRSAGTPSQRGDFYGKPLRGTIGAVQYQAARATVASRNIAKRGVSA